MGDFLSVGESVCLHNSIPFGSECLFAESRLFQAGRLSHSARSVVGLVLFFIAFGGPQTRGQVFLLPLGFDQYLLFSKCGCICFKNGSSVGFPESLTHIISAARSSE